MLSLNLALARSLVEERFSSPFSPRLHRSPQAPYQDRLAAIRSPSALEDVDFEMSLDVEEQAALSLKLKRACIIMDIEDPERPSKIDAGTEVEGSPSVEEKSGVNRSSETADKPQTCEDRKAEEGVKVHAPSGKRKHTDTNDQASSSHKRSKPTSLMQSPEKQKAAEKKEKTRKSSARIPDLSPEELARRFLDILGRNIKLPDDLVIGKIKSAKSKNVSTPPLKGPIGWSIPPRLGSKKSRPFLIYEDPEGLEHPTTPPSNSSPSRSSDDDKENVPGEVTESDLEAINGRIHEARDGDGGNGGSENPLEGTTADISAGNATRSASPEAPQRLPGIRFIFTSGPIPVGYPEHNPSLTPRIAENPTSRGPNLLPVRRPRRRRARPRAADFF